MDLSQLGDMRRLIGMSRNHMAWILNITPHTLVKWEEGTSAPRPDDEANATLEEIYRDFEAAGEWLDTEGHTWDHVIPFRIAAMKLGISTGTLHALMRRKKIHPLNFGLLGLWVSNEDLIACRK